MDNAMVGKGFQCLGWFLTVLGMAGILGWEVSRGTLAYPCEPASGASAAESKRPCLLSLPSVGPVEQTFGGVGDSKQPALPNQSYLGPAETSFAGGQESKEADLPNMPSHGPVEQTFAGPGDSKQSALPKRPSSSGTDDSPQTCHEADCVFKPGQTVVVVRPTRLLSQPERGSKAVARLSLGTELKIQKVQGEWLYTQMAQPFHWVFESDVDGFPFWWNPHRGSFPRKLPDLSGWVHVSEVVRGWGGEWWWVHVLPVQLQELVRRRASEAIEHSAPKVREAAAELLGRIGTGESIPALCQAALCQAWKENKFWKENISYGMVAWVAGRALERLGQRDPSLLRNLLQHNDPQIRELALDRSVRLGDREWLPILRQALKDQSWEVRRVAAIGLGQLGDQASIQALQEALEDPSWRVRMAAAGSLSRLGQPPLSFFQEALKHKDSEVRTAAAWELAMLGHQEALPVLAEALNDPEVTVRRAAVAGLAKLGQPAVASLREALQDKEVCELAGEALVQLGPPALPVLQEAFQTGPATVRRAAAKALLQLGWRPQTIQELVEFLLVSPYQVVNPDLPLLEIFWSEVKPILLAKLEDPKQPLEEPIEVLFRMGHEETIDALIAALYRRGTPEIAAWYDWCGHERLRQAAHQWAQATGQPLGRSPPGQPSPVEPAARLEKLG